MTYLMTTHTPIQGRIVAWDIIYLPTEGNVAVLCLVLHSKSVCQMCLHCLVRICVLSHPLRVRISHQMQVSEQ